MGVVEGGERGGRAGSEEVGAERARQARSQRAWEVRWPKPICGGGGREEGGQFSVQSGEREREKGQNRERAWGRKRNRRTYQIVLLSPQFPRRRHRLTQSEMARKRLQPQAINHKRLQPWLGLAFLGKGELLRRVFQPRRRRRRKRKGRGEGHSRGELLPHGLGDVAHVGEVADLRGEEEAEAEIGRGRRGEEFPVVDCTQRTSSSQ